MSRTRSFPMERMQMVTLILAGLVLAALGAILYSLTRYLTLD